jgi:hypothetical protein
MPVMYGRFRVKVDREGTQMQRVVVALMEEQQVSLWDLDDVDAPAEVIEFPHNHPEDIRVSTILQSFEELVDAVRIWTLTTTTFSSSPPTTYTSYLVQRKNTSSAPRPRQMTRSLHPKRAQPYITSISRSTTNRRKTA